MHGVGDPRGNPAVEAVRGRPPGPEVAAGQALNHPDRAVAPQMAEQLLADDDRIAVEAVKIMVHRDQVA
ncbi:hypothetical protein SDC9_175836 [bioreactor metagenome]|uniref:Uncharacterized protein n=1 Tax=bioreactor metagenome TaxID=1076179 RepID=A0A645GNV1_9ZZZZ